MIEIGPAVEHDDGLPAPDVSSVERGLSDGDPALARAPPRAVCGPFSEAAGDAVITATERLTAMSLIIMRVTLSPLP